jgi:hypothetical protein
MRDPFVRAHQCLARWRRGRQLVLAAILGAAVLGLAVGRSVPAEQAAETGPQVRSSLPVPHQPVSPDRVWASITATVWGYGESPCTLEPRVENRDGTWIARDLMGTQAIELRVDAEPESVEPAMREWAARICTPEPRPVYLLQFDDWDTIDALGRMLVDACPSLRVYRVHLLPPFRRWDHCTMNPAPPNAMVGL